jgi:hypothetical protein
LCVNRFGAFSEKNVGEEVVRVGGEVAGEKVVISSCGDFF